MRPKFAAGGGRVLGSGRINKPETLVSQSNNERNDIEIGLVRPGASGGQAIIEAPITQMNMNDISWSTNSRKIHPVINLR